MRGNTQPQVLPLYHNDKQKLLPNQQFQLLPFKRLSSTFNELINGILWKGMLTMGVVVYGSYSVLVHLCEVDGQIPFSSASAVLMIEVTKILFSLCSLWPQLRRSEVNVPSVMFCLPFAIPALLYSLNNNIAIHMQLHMDPTTYQVLSNMKIATTAVLYRLIIKRRLTQLQWYSLGFLTLAGISDSYAGFRVKGGNPVTEIHITLAGLLMITLYCIVSGLAGVYTEYILKKHYQESLHLQNVLLYTFGIMINGGAWLVQAAQQPHDQPGRFHLFNGYSLITWIIIITQATNGLIMSVVMKYASNITRLFLISCAMIITTVLSVMVFDTQLNTFFIIALVLVLVALVLYHR